MSENADNKVDASKKDCDCPACTGKSPHDIFEAMYADAPEQIQSFLDDKLMEIMMVDIPTLQHLMQAGPSIPAKEASLHRSVFDGSLKLLREKMPDKAPTATVAQCAEEIADVLDSSVRRVLLDDDNANRAAVAHISQCHAKLVKCLMDLALTEKQQALLAGWEEGA